VTRQVDAIIVGAEQAGPSLAGRLTDAGEAVAVVAPKLIGRTTSRSGSTCPDPNCHPTVTLREGKS
jgi:pyruvate/2-oxoglutarate dehydrogenase complex dihydrolipoamide dehydrogenase (E3) component